MDTVSYKELCAKYKNGPSVYKSCKILIKKLNLEDIRDLCKCDDTTLYTLCARIDTQIIVLEHYGVGIAGKMREDLDLYTIFQRDWLAVMTSRKNLNVIYTNYYKPLHNKFKVQKPPTVDEFKQWLKQALKLISNKKYIVGVLKTLGVEQTYIEVVNSVQECLDYVLDVWWDYKQGCEKTLRNTTSKKVSYVYKDPYSHVELILSEFKRYLTDLCKVAPTLDRVPSLTVEECIEYCMSDIKNMIIGPRILILFVLGSPHTEQVNTKRLSIIQTEKLYTRIANSVTSQYGINVKNSCVGVIDKHFEGLENIPLMSIDTLVDLTITSSKNNTLAYRIVMGELTTCSPQLVDVYDNRVPYYCKGQKRSDPFKKNVWNRELLTNIIAKVNNRVQNSSAYPDMACDQIEYRSVVVLEYIDVHVNEVYGDSIRSDNNIKWFLHTCTRDMVYKFIMDFGNSLSVQNERVKNNVDAHHAKRSVSFALGLFKRLLSDVIPCSNEIQYLTPKDFIDNIINKRVNNDSGDRRTYLDEEVTAMLKEVRTDPVCTLMINLLREIGLRAGAVCNLKYRSIFDANHQPLHHCRVLEKGKKIREFITSTNLKGAMASYSHHIRTKCDPLSTDEFFVFNVTNHCVPLSSSTLLNKLKMTALKAGVTDITVYPHAFRHTIVGKLMDEGNSSEVVSKFIGHSTPTTTLKYYWLKNIEDLLENIKNPFMNVYRDDEDKKQSYDEEYDLMSKKIEVLMGIIQVYNTQLTDSLSEDVSLREYRNRILDQIPNLNRILERVADSSICTTTTTADSRHTADSIHSFT